MSEFVRDTALRETGPGHFAAKLHPGWWIARGANGGYLAAIVARALHGGAGALALRTLTVHYASAPEPGPVAVQCEPLRRGRSLVIQRATIRQGERVILTAIGASGSPRPGPCFSYARPPTAPPPDECPLYEGPQRFHRRWETRWVFGSPPGSRATRAVAGGWIRTREPAPIDEAYVVGVCDAFSPPYFTTLAPEAIAPMPTVELTVHLRRTLSDLSLVAGDFLCARFESKSAAEGYIDEVGEVWTEDGVLLAECRQLATFVAPEPPPQ